MSGRKFHPARFDFRQIEDVVYQGPQMLAAILDGRDRRFDIGSKLPFALQNLGVAEDSVQRGADFMAHVSQKGTLGAIGNVSGVFGFLELGILGFEELKVLVFPL